MSRKSKQLTPQELYDQIIELPFEERVELFERIKSNINGEATTLKELGEKASKILQTINSNGK